MDVDFSRIYLVLVVWLGAAKPLQSEVNMKIVLIPLWLWRKEVANEAYCSYEQYEVLFPNGHKTFGTALSTIKVMEIEKGEPTC